MVDKKETCWADLSAAPLEYLWETKSAKTKAGSKAAPKVGWMAELWVAARAAKRAVRTEHCLVAPWAALWAPLKV